MLRATILTVLAASALVVTPARAQGTPSPKADEGASSPKAANGAPSPKGAEGATPSRKDSEVYFIWPHDGTVIKGGKFWLRMGLHGMGVAPKGVKVANTGHHHVLIDTDLPAMNEQIPSDRNHLHFGGGETEARIELPPGKHTLQLILGDFDHKPHDPPVYSKKITVFVK